VKGTSVNVAEFVGDWLAGMSTANLAQKYEVSQGTLYTWVTKLRLAGVKIPGRRKGPKRFVIDSSNAASLNKLISKAESK